MFSAEDWSRYIGEIIKQAEDDGYLVEISNECCGCSSMELLVNGISVTW